MNNKNLLALLLVAMLLPVTQASAAQQNESRIKTLEEKVEALSKALENRQASSADSKTSIGGYGELHYSRKTQDDKAKKNEVDFHRFVLFVSHEFASDIRFVSELELEHSLSGGGKPGEVELEQAYIEIDHNDSAQTQAGLFLIPIGILNETHEPTTFYGVERNDVENIIIPSTWWEAGAQHIRRFGEGWQVNLAVHSGLETPTTGGSAFRIRSGREKVAKANGSKIAYTGRIKYTGIPGLELAASVQVQDDPSQAAGDGLDDGTLFETHLVYQKGAFGVRALYTAWDLSGAAVEAAANNADKQSGWYVEPSYRLNDKFGFFVRASSVEAARASDNFDQVDVGVNWWLHENIVVKADFRKREHDLASEAGKDSDTYSLGLGYHF